MRKQAEDVAVRVRDNMVPIHEMEMCIYKIPRLRTIRENDPSRTASGSQLTETKRER